ncbi:MAG: ABC transporter substrate-binding protein [Candidatus Symbiobacter sp.]|nr:ABC transporter substrate-binding protein [Candidatus Symbiobacter sp.]
MFKLLGGWRLRQFTAAAVALMIGLAAGQVAAQTTQDFSREAAKAMTEITDNAFAVFRNTTLNKAQKKAVLHDLLIANVDVNSVMRFLFGRTIKTMTPQQRTELTRLISEFVVNSYAVNMANYGNYKFNITDARMDGPSAVVYTEILRPKTGGKYNVIWRMVMDENRPKLVDCIVEGISINLTQRQQFSDIMDRSGKGVDGVIESLRDRLARFND